ncbi:MAG: alpha/beta hydrolase [Flavobacteriales bacterium]|nr:alpha/beta hydrolase [Flavobacteriales bacterium]
MKKNNTNLPGRLGNKSLELKDDYRAEPRIINALKEFELDGYAPGPPDGIRSSSSTIMEFMNESEPQYQGIFADWFKDEVTPHNVETYKTDITGVDGNIISLTISKPIEMESEIPAILHIHGGGMTILTAEDPNYVTWRGNLASKGLVVVGVEFRNVAGKLGDHPFPAGLNDCLSALDWLYKSKKDLGVSKIIISGESGGGNLSLATTLKAKDNGKIEQIDGVFAQCPYISNKYGASKSELPSLIENDGYFLNVEMLDIMASMYDGPKSKNPYAWPLYANNDLLKGLPPHIITVNELDPLRDEGIEYYRMLLRAEVDVRAITLNGTVHAAEGIFKKFMPEPYESVINQIKEFAHSL